MEEANRSQLGSSLSDYVALYTKDEISRTAITRIKTGFPGLDAVLGGGLAPGLTVLGATTNTGKSTLMLQLAENVAASGHTVFYYSLEMTAQMIAAKAVSRQLFLDNGRKKEGICASDLTNYEVTSRWQPRVWRQVDAARDKVEKRSQRLRIIEFNGEAKPNAAQIKNDISRFVEQTGEIPLVIVDYLQILKPDNQENRGASDKQLVDQTVRILGDLQREKNIPLVLISSLSRGNYNYKVQMDAFKESGGIEYSADALIGLSFAKAPEHDRDRKKNSFSMMEAKQKFPREMELTVLKQRYGASGNAALPFRYYAKFDYFEEQSQAQAVVEQENSEQENAAQSKPKNTRHGVFSCDFDDARLAKEI